MSDDPDSDDQEIDYDEADPLASWKAVALPNWTWEAYEVEARDKNVVVDLDEDDEPITKTTDIYRGRVKSPKTFGNWEYGSFAAWELRRAGAFRTDEDTGEWP